MRKFGFENEYGASLNYGIRFLEFPKFEYGKEIVESKTIPGRVGTIMVKTGKYEDTIITNSLEFQCSKLSEYESKLQSICKWISKTSILKYTDSEDKFYCVKKIEINNITRKYGFFCVLEVRFICKTATYLTDGTNEYPLSQLFYNQYSWCEPNYIIIGEGVCDLTINGKTMKVNVSQDIVINTELMISYHLDNTSQNTAVSGNYDDLYLQEGMNEISVTEGFECKIIPNWRCL